jgi:hypothetical protein
MTMRFVLSGVVLAASLAAQFTPFHAVVPNSAEGVEGASSTALPFGSSLARHVLYAYDGSVVGYLAPVRIAAIELRCDGAAPGSSSAGTYTFTLNASTGKHAVGALDVTFANNHGADKVLVHSGTIAVPAPATGSSPNAFSLRIPFSTEFEWDPRLGPLVLDFGYSSATPAFGSWDAVAAGVGGLAASGSTAAIATSVLTTAPVLQLDLSGKVAPAAFTNAEAPSGTGFPWNQSSGVSMRALNLYEGSVMGFTGRQRITALAWRMDAGAAFAGRTYDVRITLSTTAATAATINATFANDIGADATVVFDGLLVAGPSPASADFAQFDLFCELSRPFEYDPQEGSLSVDMQMRGATGAPGANFDCSNSSGTLAARVTNNTSATAAIANLGSQPGVAMVMAMRTVPVPTAPASLSNAANAAAGNATAFPFGSTTSRSLQLVSAAEATLSQPTYVRALRFRPGSTLTSFGPTTFTCTIDLSSAATTPGTVNATFDNNHGTNRTRVFDGSFSVPFGTWATGDTGFPIEVELQHPFLWNAPSVPYLCIDFVMSARVGPAILIETTFNMTTDDARVTSTSSTSATGNAQTIAATVQLSGFGRNGIALNYGTGCAGTNGAPIATTVGLPSLPNPDFGARVRNAAGNAAALYLVGLAPLSVPLPGTNNCLVLNAGEIGMLGAVITDAVGDGVLPLPLLGSPANDGFQFRGQWLILDPGANPLGITTSDAQLLTARFF